MLRKVIPVLLFVGLWAAIAEQAQAVLIGNDVSVGRASSADGGDNIMMVYFNAPVPGTGTIDSFLIWDVSNNTHAGGVFHAYVLRPTATPNEYFVVSDNTLQATASIPGVTKTYSVAPISVLAGDLIAHRGTGVPFTGGTGPSFLPIRFSTAPTVSTNYTLAAPSATFIRDYAFAANFIPVPEPSAVSLATLGAFALYRCARNRRRPDAITA